MEVSTAREIIKRAKADDTYEGPMPDDDATCIKEAEGLVEMAEAAWAQHIRGPEVEAILRLAAGNQDGDEPDEKSEEEEAPKGGGKPPSALTDAPEGLAKSEPWDGYGEYTVSDVTSGLNWYFENDPENFLDLLKHVWAYETAHKKRARIQDFVVEFWSRAGGEVDEEEKKATPKRAAPKVKSGAKSGSDNGTSEAEATEAEEEADDDGAAEEDEDESADAGDESEREDRAEDREGGDGEGQPDTESKAAGSGAYRKLIEIVEKELKNERLDGIPSPPDEEAPTLPWKWADVTNKQLHDMHMQFASFAYYKGYVRARDERIAMHCKEAADELSNKLLVKADKYDEKGKEIRVTFLEAEIAQDPNVKRWRKLQRKHESLAAQARQEQESYYKLVEALSRLETMRHQAWERSK